MAALVCNLVRKSSLHLEEPNPEKRLCLLSDHQEGSLAKTFAQRRPVQSHAMNSSTPHVSNTPATLNTRHRPNLIEYDGAGDESDALNVSAVRDRKKRGRGAEKRPLTGTLLK